MIPFIVGRKKLVKSYYSPPLKQTIIQKLRIGKVFYLFLLFVPLSLFSAVVLKNDTFTFITCILAIVPLARIMGYTTKEISLQSNPTVSGLLSATFGNAIELIIAIFALRAGLIQVVQASIIGSIIGNILLLVGLSIFAGGLRYKNQRFNNETIAVSSTMLIIVVAGLAIPSVYDFLKPHGPHIQVLSAAVAVVMTLIYLAGLFFSLRTHRDLFDASDEMKATHERPTMSKRLAAIILLLTVAVVAIESEFLVRAIETAAVTIGITQTFIGIVVIAIITNIAENSTAVHFALENKLDVSIEIGLSSAIQIALFVVPILMLVSSVFNFGFTLVFTPFEILAVMLAVLIVNYLSADGRCNWLEGAQLISVYAIIAIAFFFVA
ncbi:MAG TPA: calcium/proton exchanger [Thermoplasmata archaeon]|jgi:Ca2+:H+ antiporter|nr:MAG TPA: calcium/proton exchanger [Thermoplasmata archaeon]